MNITFHNRHLVCGQAAQPQHLREPPPPFLRVFLMLPYTCPEPALAKGSF